MKRCSRCLQAETRPGLLFDKDGICFGCRNYNARKTMDWESRLDSLKKKIQGKVIAIAVSGGKDSYAITHLAVSLGAQPVLIRVGDPFRMWPNMKENIQHLQDEFKCPMIQWQLDFETYRKLCRAGLEEKGNLPWLDVLIYLAPIHIAGALGLPYVLFGEDSAYQYGSSTEEREEVDVSGFVDTLRWMEPYLHDRDFRFLRHSTWHTNRDLVPLYTSYFVPWSARTNYDIAEEDHGFKDCGMERMGHIERYSQLDSLGWQVSNALKYRKMGFSRATDTASALIREGELTKEEGKALILKHDKALDQVVLADFLRVSGYSVKEWETLSDKWWNRDLFGEEKGKWVMKQEHRL